MEEQAKALEEKQDELEKKDNRIKELEKMLKALEENWKFLIPSLWLCIIHKLGMRKAPEMPGHKGRAEMGLNMI